MKRRPLFYSIATFAVIALIVGIISYAAERHPTQTGSSTTPVEQTATPPGPISLQRGANLPDCQEEILRVL